MFFVRFFLFTTNLSKNSTKWKLLGDIDLTSRQLGLQRQPHFVHILHVGQSVHVQLAQLVQLAQRLQSALAHIEAIGHGQLGQRVLDVLQLAQGLVLHVLASRQLDFAHLRAALEVIEADGHDRGVHRVHLLNGTPIRTGSGQRIVVADQRLAGELDAAAVLQQPLGAQPVGADLFQAVAVHRVEGHAEVGEEMAAILSEQ